LFLLHTPLPLFFLVVFSFFFPFLFFISMFAGTLSLEQERNLEKTLSFVTKGW
jgi:hypothetical protein